MLLCMLDMRLSHALNDHVTVTCSMILSRGAIDRMVQRGVKCPSPDHPDDMFLGSTAKYYKIDVVFSPLYHQVGSHDKQNGCH